ncbi:MAG: LysE family translocator, partial [Paracoccaceae bacterium]
MSVGIISFAAFAFSQVATPGPANMAMLATGARYGFRAALPFVAGVVLGKQLIIWPIGFGLMSLADQLPLLFVLLKYVSAAYIIWLAWRVANMRLSVNKDTANAPGFVAGLWVHPLNPKAWAMIVAGFTNFVDPGTATLTATAIIALSLMVIQIICHPVWTFFGDRIAKLLI